MMDVGRGVDQIMELVKDPPADEREMRNSIRHILDAVHQHGHQEGEDEERNGWQYI